MDEELTVGTRVSIKDKSQLGRGTIRFVGPVKFSTKPDWVGVELDSPLAKHNGTVKGVQYFSCDNNKGLFCSASKLVPLRTRAGEIIRRGAQPPPTQGAKTASGGKTKPPMAKTPSGRSVRASDPKTTSSGRVKPPVNPKTASSGRAKPPVNPKTASSGRLKPPVDPKTASSGRVKPTDSTGRRVKPADKAPGKKPRSSVPTADISRLTQPTRRSSLPAKGLSDREKRKTKSPIRRPPGDDDPRTKRSSRPPSQATSRSSSPSRTSAASSRNPSRNPSPKSTPASSDSEPDSHTTTNISDLENKARLAGYQDADSLLAELRELTEWKKTGQETIKALHARMQSITKEKEQLAEQIDKHEAEQGKEDKKSHKAYEREIEKLKRAHEEELEDMEDELDTLKDTIEMLTLDKELAEEKCEGLEDELADLKSKWEIKDLEESSDLEGEEDSGLSKDAEVLKAQNQRLTDALMKLKDISLVEKKEAEKKVKILEMEKKVIPVLEEKVEKLKKDLKSAHDTIDQLKEELDVALEAEDIIEELTDKNMSLEEKVEELQQTIEDLEDLKMISEELEENQSQVEKELRSQMYQKEIKLLDALGVIKNHQNTIVDREKTIEQFREKVTALQHKINKFEKKEVELDSQTSELNNQSLTLMDQNRQLQSSVLKVHAMKLEQQLKQLEVVQVNQHLHFMQSFLPESVFSKDQDCFKLQLTLGRISFKCNLIAKYVKRNYKLSEVSFNLINAVELHHAEDELVFAATIYNNLMGMKYDISIFKKTLLLPELCDTETYLKMSSVFRELLPYETKLDAFLTLIKKEELNSNVDIAFFDNFHERLQRIAALYFMEGKGKDISEVEEEKEKVCGSITPFEPPVWKSLTLELHHFMFSHNLFLLQDHILKRSFASKVGQVGIGEALVTIPLSLCRDIADISRKLKSHLKAKPVMPRHYVNTLETKIYACSKKVMEAMEVIKNVTKFVNESFEPVPGNENDLKLVSDALLNILGDRFSPDLHPNKGKEKEAAEAGEEKEGETSEDKKEPSDEEKKEKGNEEANANPKPWEWFDTVFGEVKTGIGKISDKIISNSQFPSQDGSVRLSLSIKSDSSSTKDDDRIVPAWEQRVENIRNELMDAASVRGKLADKTTESSQRLREIKALKQDIKEHLSRQKVLEIQVQGIQKKEQELQEELKKKTAQYMSQEKMYEEALELTRKDNEALQQAIRNSKNQIQQLENQSREIAEQKAELPSLEVVSAEIKSLRRALKSLRRDNVYLKALHNQHTLRSVLPPLTLKESEAIANLKCEPIVQDELDQQETPRERRGQEVKALRTELNKTLRKIQETKATVKVLDLSKKTSKDDTHSLQQEWASKKLETAKLTKQYRELKAKVSGVLMGAPNGTTKSDFGSFPSADVVMKVNSPKPALIGHVSFPEGVLRKDSFALDDISSVLRDLRPFSPKVVLSPADLHQLHLLLS